ncbi:short chain dehydrogenase reductase family [Colletotrichum truncatum]|uniref:Short chain dehydrogenase reductase family n=1 Tax=Colletotrichum truncatum TaxID=5467 RepID=A0ACC3YSD5_COLTU|nr:short chain dehydrogenase reductase family [Colletotrichum truncatum]KAF6789803.1 short chain dehydrogenase reductase family [Colletotrichum truncatum]
MATQNFKYLNKLRSSRVLIIGGSQGLGFAAAEASIEHGASVILVSSNPKKLANAADRLQTTYASIVSPGQVSTYTIDLADLTNLRTNLTRLLDEATADGEKKIDHVVYTADLAPPLPPLPQTTPEDIHAAFSLRAHAPIILAGLLNGSEKYIRHTPDTSVTFTNGSSSHRPMPGWAVADSAAGSMEGLVRGLSCSLAPVRVNLVSSGPVTTELFQTLPAETIELFRSKCLTGRLGRPEDVVEAYLYIMKDGFVTGATIFTEGGRILAP